MRQRRRGASRSLVASGSDRDPASVWLLALTWWPPASPRSPRPLGCPGPTSAAIGSDGNAANSWLNQSSGIVRETSRGTSGRHRPTRSCSHSSIGLWCARARLDRRDMSSGNGFSTRPDARIPAEVIEPAQHRLAVGHGGRRVAISGCGLAGHRVRRPRRPARPAWRPGPRRLQALLDGQPNPAAEVPGLGPGRPVPRHADRVQELPPPQQVHRIRAQRRRRLPGRPQVAQRHHHRFRDPPVGADRRSGSRSSPVHSSRPALETTSPDRSRPCSPDSVMPAT